VATNDLTEAHAILSNWFKGQKTDSELATWVPKARITENDQVRLLGARYKDKGAPATSSWPIHRLGDIADVRKGTAITQKDTRPGMVPVIAGGQSPAYFHDTANRTGKTITVSASGAYAGFVNYFESPIFASDCSTIVSKDESAIRTDFLHHVLKALQEQIYELQTGGGQPHVYPRDLVELQLPVPPPETQALIIAQVESQRNTIQSAQTLIEECEQAIQAAVLDLWE
jgi:type I restriction enzyme M protein